MGESRLFKIMNYLLIHKRTTASCLAELCEVSVRTVYRDIDALSVAGMPVYCLQGKGGGIRLMEEFTLDRRLLAESEQLVLLEALAGMSQILGGDKDLLAKLKTFFRQEPVDWVAIDLTRWGSRRQDSDNICLIKRAIFEKRLLHFNYYSSQKLPDVKKVKPVKLIYKSTAWYLEAYCLTKQAYRFYRLSRMMSVELTNDFFERRLTSHFLEEAMSTMHQSVELKFTPTVRYRVMDEFAEETITINLDKSLTVKVELPIDQWLEGYLLSFLEQVEVVSPLSLKQRMRQVIEKLWLASKKDLEIEKMGR